MCVDVHIIDQRISVHNKYKNFQVRKKKTFSQSLRHVSVIWNNVCGYIDTCRSLGRNLISCPLSKSRGKERKNCGEKLKDNPLLLIAEGNPIAKKLFSSVSSNLEIVPRSRFCLTGIKCLV